MITDRRAARGRDLAALVAEAIRGGADVVQLRDKEAPDASLAAEARRLLDVTRPAGVPLIVNDRIAVALAAGADGVHLGQSDASLAEARTALGPRAIIGRSTHTPEQAVLAEREGFDYIGVGPVFGTPTKPDYDPVGLELVRFAATSLDVPFVAIGGIDETNVDSVRSAGARAVAVVRALMGAEDPRVSAARLRGSAEAPSR